SHRTRHLAEDRIGLIEVIHVEERTDQDTGRSTEQNADRTAEDPDDQADDATGRGALVADVSDLVLDGDRAVLVALHDGRTLEGHLALIVELLERGQRLVGVTV